jgi:molecular chaperone Hsp33
VLSLGEKEIRDILENKGEAELVCHYCSKKYLFNAPELEKLLEFARQPENNGLKSGN